MKHETVLSQRPQATGKDNNIIDVLALGASHVVHDTKIQRLLLANDDTQESTEA